MRNGPVLALLAAALLLGCSDGGSSSSSFDDVVEQIQYFHLGAVRADAPTVVALEVRKPFHPEATVALDEVVGTFEPGDVAEAQSGSNFLLWITFTPPATPASALQEGTIRLLFRRVSGGEAHPVTLRLDAELETPSAILLQPDIAVGKAAVGESVRFDVMLENTSVATPIRITDVTLPDGEFSIAPDAFLLPMPVGPGSRFFVPVLYTPKGEWTATSMITIRHSASPAPFEAALRGTGVAPLLFRDFDDVPLDPSTFESQWLEFEVPAEGVGIHIDAWSDDSSSLVDLIGFEGPLGTVYETEALAGPLDWLTHYPAGARGYLNVDLPHSDNPAIDLVPGGGTYRFRLRDSAFLTDGLHVVVTVSQRRPGPVKVGTLDLRVFVAAGLGIDPSGPMADAKLAATMKTIDAILGLNGIRLGAISFSFMDPAHDTVASAAATEDLVALYTSGLPEGPLNLFLVKDMSYGVDGIAGAVPGPRANGTPYSGVVIDFGAANGFTVGATASHEMVHYLGHHDTDGVDEVLLHPEEAFAVLRHPLMQPGLPADLVSPPEATNYDLVFAVIEMMAPMGTWCGTCMRLPPR